ncbi:MAG: hypothetical protein NTW56_11655 [Alphaproteobacteria bacterium]|nr:hypothetical protein [Alphaproteobacteria bacterium]
MPKSWTQKAASARPAHVAVLDKPFAGVPAGARLLIPSPPLIEAYLRAIPRGEVRPITQLRAELAAAEAACATCPVTTAIHTRILAEIAIEALDAGMPPEAVAPFWRVVEPGSELAHRLSIGPAGIERLRAAEAA